MRKLEMPTCGEGRWTFDFWQVVGVPMQLSTFEESVLSQKLFQFFEV